MVQSRHYPFCHRNRGIRYVESAVAPSFTDFNSPSSNPATVGITKLTDLLDSGTAPTFSSFGVAVCDYVYVLSDKTPAVFPAGWAIDSNDSMVIRYTHYVANSFPTFVKYTRQEQRVAFNAFFIGCTFSALLRAINGANNVTVTLSGRWGAATDYLGGIGPDPSAYIDDNSQPTAYRLSDSSEQQQTTNYTSADITISVNTVVSTGTVPIAVGTYMTDLRDQMVTDLNAATPGAVWSVAAIPAGVKTTLHNYTNLINGQFDPRRF